MTIPDTIFDTINDNWGAGGYAGVAPAIDTTETQTSSDKVTANVIEVRAHTLRERGEQKNDKFVNRHYTLDVYISTKTSAAQLTLLYDEVEYLLRNTAMTGIQIEHIDKDWSASEWEEGLHATVMRVAVVALLSDGAVTSAAGVTASMQALLMYTSANAAWVPCGFDIGGPLAKYQLSTSTERTYTNIDGTDLVLRFIVPLAPAKGSLKLYISGVRSGVLDADAGDYITTTSLRGLTYNAQTLLNNDTTNYTSSARNENTFTAVDCSTYDVIVVIVIATVTDTDHFDLTFCSVRCYYDT